MGELIDARTLPVGTTPTSPQVLPPPEKGSRLVWTKEMDQAYINSLFAAHHDGKRVEPGGLRMRHGWPVVQQSNKSIRSIGF
jgi:hypothetical protein